MSVFQFLRDQSKEYQCHVQRRNKLEKAIAHQHQIQLTKRIPRQYKPKILNPVFNTTQLQREFETEYDTLFFHHLNKVMTQNQISVELEKGALQSIVTQTIRHISCLDKPKEEIHQLYQQFLQNNEIDPNNLPPELRNLIQKTVTSNRSTSSLQSNATPAPSTIQVKVTQPEKETSSCTLLPKNRKRKRSTQPPATKKSKQHILELGINETLLTVHNLST